MGGAVVKWADLRTVDFERLDRNIPVILNIGAIEQHGPALPVETDALIGAAFLDMADNRMKDSVLVLPQIAVGCSSHHMGFGGSLTVRHETMLAYVSDVIDSVISHGFKNIVLFNSHGGNLGIGQVLLEHLGYRHSSTNLFLFTWWQIAGQELRDIQESPFGGVGHACEFETSLLLFFKPELVDRERLLEPQLKPSFDWANADMLNAPCGHYYRNMDDLSNGTGVVGAPQFASAEKGRRIADAVVGKLCVMLSDIYAAGRDASGARARSD